MREVQLHYDIFRGGKQTLNLAWRKANIESMYTRKRSTPNRIFVCTFFGCSRIVWSLKDADKRRTAVTGNNMSVFLRLRNEIVNFYTLHSTILFLANMITISHMILENAPKKMFHSS